jgi:hypothetical protein
MTQASTSNRTHMSKPPPLDFVSFVAARQRVLERRRAGLPREEWTDDPILATARFCNIDRRDDFVSAELIAELGSRPSWALRERVLLCAALRFSGSRRGEAAPLADLVEAGRAPGATKGRGSTPLCAALEAEEVRCGTGTYQLSLNRRQVASRIEHMATAVIERVASAGPFADVLEASDFVAEHMTVGKRPQFSSNECAKDFAYVDGLMQPASHHRCRLGPGAKKGLSLVRATDGAAPGKSELGGMDDEAAVAWLRTALRRRPSLEWVESIDVEQALCEFSKYEAYRSRGISSSKQFRPAQPASTKPRSSAARGRGQRTRETD